MGRADILAFTSRLAHLQRTGQMTFRTRLRVTRRVFRFLGDLHVLGMTGPGQPAAGLPAAFALRRDDIPKDPDRETLAPQPAPRRAAGHRGQPARVRGTVRGFRAADHRAAHRHLPGAPMRSAPWPGTASNATPRAARC